MRAAIVTALCVSLGCAGLARADLKVGTYAPDVEAKEWMNTAKGEPVSLAEQRGMIVVLFFWVTWHKGGERIMPLMTLVNGSVGEKGGIFLIGLTDAERKGIEPTVKRDKVFFPIGVEAKKSVDDYQISTFPAVVIIDPTGKVAWSGLAGEEGEKGAPKLIEEIRKVAAATPPTKTHPKLAAKAQACLQQCRRALRDDKYVPALEIGDKAYDYALEGDTLKVRTQEPLDLIEALGRDKLARADAAADAGKYEDAVTLLLEVRREFKGAEAAAAARRKIEFLKTRHSEIVQFLKLNDDAGQAEVILKTALDQVRARKFGPAYDKLEQIVNEYSSTDTATKAQTVLDRMTKNADIMAYVRDHKAARECERLLSQARAYEQTGQTDKARAFLREILEKYADTKYADEAAQRLMQLP